jgi:3-deoxy-7-phosphoheptulonate synthase
MPQQAVSTNRTPGSARSARARRPQRSSRTPVTEDLYARSEGVLLTPHELKWALPLSESARDFVASSRQTIRNILAGDDHRLLVVVGPCSIHDPEAALEYARRLRVLADEVGDTLYLVMRVYVEKPRTLAGWKGLVNDPDLDGSFRINKGLATARRLLIDVAEMGLPAATEAVNPISQHYFHELVSWTAIGARTTEAQTHREMASSLSSPVGFKNGTDGNVLVAVNAMRSSAQPHSFLGVDGDGRASIVQTEGNRDAHVVLRGGAGKPNYDSASVASCERLLIEHGLEPSIMIDCSHANSSYKHELQPVVLEDVVGQVLAGNESIRAVMVESNLYAGNQPLAGKAAGLQYGVSITDSCVDWETTERSLAGMREVLRHVLPGRGRAARASKAYDE